MKRCSQRRSPRITVGTSSWGTQQRQGGTRGECYDFSGDSSYDHEYDDDGGLLGWVGE